MLIILCLRHVGFVASCLLCCIHRSIDVGGVLFVLLAACIVVDLFVVRCFMMFGYVVIV